MAGGWCYIISVVPQRRYRRRCFHALHVINSHTHTNIKIIAYICVCDAYIYAVVVPLLFLLLLDCWYMHSDTPTKCCTLSARTLLYKYVSRVASHNAITRWAEQPEAEHYVLLMPLPNYRPPCLPPLAHCRLPAATRHGRRCNFKARLQVASCLLPTAIAR